MIRTLARVIIRTFFREVVLEGHDRLPEAGPVIFTPNHPNGLIDPLFLFFLSSSFRIRFVAKEPLFRYPLLGSILRSIGAIPVVRRMDTEGEIDYTAFFAACVDSLASGDSIAIFPEGASLPQAYLAPLKTGPARLFFMTQTRGVTPSIVPIGLNYDRAKIFRSDVYVSIGSPLITSKYAEQYARQPSAAIRGLTEEIGRGLQENLVQAESFRDKELMILLERLISETEDDATHRSRFARLKAFENGLQKLRNAYPAQIDRIRKWLERYRRLKKEFAPADPEDHHSGISPGHLIFGLLGLIPAFLGWLFNLLPYYICDAMIRITKRDESDAATFKVIFSIFLFPILYILEFLMIARFAGWVVAFLFLALIVPLSYFTLNFFEWVSAVFSGKLRWGGRTRKRVQNQLNRLKQRIVSEMEWLATRPELESGVDE